MIPFPRREIRDEDDALDWWAEDGVRCFEFFGATVVPALLIRSIVEDLRSFRNAAASKPLSLAEAAKRSGYSADHIGRLVREGKVPNHGRKHSPKVLAHDLPLKTKADLAATSGNSYNPDADALSLVNTRRIRRSKNAS